MSASTDGRSTTYTLTVHRAKKRWILKATVGEAVITIKARRLDQATALARKVIARRLEVSERSFATEVKIDLPADVQTEIDRTRAAITEAATARARASLLGHGTAKHLKRVGLGRRDIGVLIGVSPAKVTKLLEQY